MYMGDALSVPFIVSCIECISRDLSLKSVFMVFRRKPSMGAPGKEYLIPENTFVIYYNLMANGFT